MNALSSLQRAYDNMLPHDSESKDSKLSTLTKEQDELLNNNIIHDAAEKFISDLIPAGILNHEQYNDIITDNGFIELSLEMMDKISNLVAEYRYKNFLIN